MRKLFVLLVVVFVVLLAINKQRVYLRDPLGTVYRNGAEAKDARVYINYFNDVLVEEPTESRTYIVQNWNKIPGTPKALNCLRGIMCWTENNHADMVPLGGASTAPNTQMSDREVSFDDSFATGVRVTLR